MRKKPKNDLIVDSFTMVSDAIKKGEIKIVKDKEKDKKDGNKR